LRGTGGRWNGGRQRAAGQAGHGGTTAGPLGGTTSGTALHRGRFSIPAVLLTHGFPGTKAGTKEIRGGTARSGKPAGNDRAGPDGAGGTGRDGRQRAERQSPVETLHEAQEPSRFHEPLRALGPGERSWTLQPTAALGRTWRWGEWTGL